MRIETIKISKTKQTPNRLVNEIFITELFSVKCSKLNKKHHNCIQGVSVREDKPLLLN